MTVRDVRRVRRGWVLGGLVAVFVAMAAVALLVVGRGAPQPATVSSTPAVNPIEQVSGLPPGATACEPVYTGLTAYQRGARGTPQTSCAFVEQVRQAYDDKRSSSLGTQQMRVASPSTGKWYDLVCSPTGSFVTCTGAVGAVVYLY